MLLGLQPFGSSNFHESQFQLLNFGILQTYKLLLYIFKNQNLVIHSLPLSPTGCIVSTFAYCSDCQHCHPVSSFTKTGE